jgi:hypothetical protein
LDAISVIGSPVVSCAISISLLNPMLAPFDAVRIILFPRQPNMLMHRLSMVSGSIIAN